MKRVIKFRGKRTDTGEWAYGSLIKFDIGYVITISETTESDDSLDEKNSIVFSADEIAGVNPDTIGQFTGLLDKNGKDIYEGDIITVNGKHPKLVRFIDEWASFCLANVVDLDEDMDTGYWHQVSPGWWTSYTREIEVIGNVFDNLSLIQYDITKEIENCTGDKVISPIQFSKLLEV